MEKIFAKIAKENNTTKEQVEKDIQNALGVAIKNSKGNKNAEKFWKEVLQSKDTPDAESVIKKIAENIIKENNKIKQQNSDGRF